ncbi:MAG: dihydropteroate synthase [Longimicrobiales bacterium]|nr:dihydropteroate synthase [Longimicrobiales bacterium]
MSSPLRCGPHRLPLDRTHVMGVLNLTPDSFSDGGHHPDAGAAIAHAERMIAEGAGIVDVGGESTAPGREPVPADEEMRRVLPVVRAVAAMGVVVSIDSYKPDVVRACLEAGATLINDVTGGEDPAMVALAREFDVPLILMHMKGSPRTMQLDPRYDDVVEEVAAFFGRRLEGLEGVQTVLDPGIGFGKTVEHNLQLLRGLTRFASFGRPLLVGASRKRFIGALTGAEVHERIPGTIAAHTIAILKGARIIRAHDVKEARQAATVADALRGSDA